MWVRRSPPEQVSEGQPGTAELLVEPDAESVQGHPRRQARPQPLKLVRTLSPEAEGIKKLVVGGLSTIWRMPATQRLKRLGHTSRALRLGGQR